MEIFNINNGLFGHVKNLGKKIQLYITKMYVYSEYTIYCILCIITLNFRYNIQKFKSKSIFTNDVFIHIEILPHNIMVMYI